MLDILEAMTESFEPDAFETDAFARPAQPAVTILTLTHAGLGAVDPWAPERKSLRATLWPWGLAGLAETIEVVVLALMMFVAVRSVAHNYRVEGSSMVPSFQNGQLLIVNRLAYRSFDLGWIPVIGRDDWQPFGTPHQGDVVVFIAQTNPRERDFIKRIVGLPGQTVEVRDGHVLVDGIAYSENYIEAPPSYVYPPTTVPPGHLFVLGDNRNNSLDSHLIGMVAESAVIGRVDVRYWPLSAVEVMHGRFGTAITSAEAALSR